MNTARNLSITVLCALCLLAALAVCGFTFSLLYDVELTANGGGDISHTGWLIARTALGVVLLGLMCGANAVFNFSVWIFKALSEAHADDK